MGKEETGAFTVTSTSASGGSAINEKDGFMASTSMERRVLVWTGASTFLFAGAVMGFGPMQLLLERDGVYASECNVAFSDGRRVICDEQVVALLNVPIACATMAFFSPLLGYIGDRFGSHTLYYLASFMGCVGTVFIMVASFTQYGDLLYLAFGMLYVMFLALSILTTRTGLLFQAEERRRVITLLNVLLDAGAITYLVLWYIAVLTEATLTYIMAGYLGMAIFCFGMGSFYWHTISKRSLPPAQPHGEEQQSLAASKVQETDGDDGQSCYCDRDSNTNHVLIRKRRPGEQLCSRMYIALLCFFIFHENRNLYVMATARDFLKSLGDDAVGNMYLSIFQIMMPASLLSPPFIDYVLGHHGYYAGLQTINALGLVHGSIQLCTRDLNVQVAGFLVFIFYRAFLFAVIMSCLPTFLSEDGTGTDAGWMSAVTALGRFMNGPLVAWAVLELDGFFDWPNFLYTIGIVPMMALAYIMGRQMEREKLAEGFICPVCLSKQASSGST